MPRSKRQKLVSLTKVAKKTKEHKSAQITELQENVDKWAYVWLFEVGNMRNAHLKTVRRYWKDSARIFFGRGAVMAKALGTTPEEEHAPGISALASRIKGQVGLLFTDSPPAEVIEWFKDFQQPDFARAGNTAPSTVTLPAGPVLSHHSEPAEPLPHNEEPQLRRLGLSTRMARGVPTLDVPHVVCSAGKTVTPEQAQLLKLTGRRTVVFRVALRCRWEKAGGEVVDVDEPEFRLEAGAVEAGEEPEADEEGGAMSD